MKTEKPEKDTQKELLQSQTNVDEFQDKPNSSNLVIREEIKGTPFHLINYNNEGWFVALGKYRMTETGKDKEELIKMVENKDWTLILDTIAVLTENVK